MFDVLIPVPFLIVGFLITFKRERFIEQFSAAKKAAWSNLPFGLKAMAPVYREGKAKLSLLIIGPLFLCIGLLLCVDTYLSFSGPGSSRAMRESRNYLTSHYGFSLIWKVSSSSAAKDGS